MDDQIALNVTLSSIQDLPETQEIREGDVFAVAQREGEDWQTRRVGYSQIDSALGEKYNLSGLSGIYGKMSAIVDVQATLSADVGNPYVISSLTFKDGKPISAAGYRLSSVLSVQPEPGHEDDERERVAILWFSETSAAIEVPKPKENVVTFNRWN